MKRILMAAVGLLAMVSSGASLRRLPAVTVPEGASLEIGAETAVNLRSSNTALASVTPPDGGRATVSGVRLGNVEIVYSDVKGPIAVRPVTVVPNYWETLLKFFEDDPEISVSVSGDKVIVTGKTANPDTLRHVEKAKEFDSGRIVSHVTYSSVAIGSLVGEYLSHLGYSNVTATVIGHDVCLSGRLYDEKAIKQVGERAKQFLSDFPGMTVNTDALKIVKQKIVLEVELLEYDTTLARNLGIQTPESITAEGKFDYGWDFSRNLSDGRDGSLTDNSTEESGWSWDKSNASGKDSEGKDLPSSVTETWKNSLSRSLTGKDGWTDKRDTKNNLSLKSAVSVSDVKVKITLLKQNGASKTLYKTSLATQSGEEAEFQNGGTIHRSTQSTFSNGDIKQIDYGFIVKATPLILDPNTVSLTIDLDNKSPPDKSAMNNLADIDIARFQTKSKYLVKPGEMIVMSGFDQGVEGITKSGTPFLSHIPFIGEWLFGSRSVSENKMEKLLVVTVNWALEDEAAEAVRRRDEIRNRKVDVEMP